jgi:hypothetical protein
MNNDLSQPGGIVVNNRGTNSHHLMIGRYLNRKTEVGLTIKVERRTDIIPPRRLKFCQIGHVLGFKRLYMHAAVCVLNQLVRRI